MFGQNIYTECISVVNSVFAEECESWKWTGRNNVVQNQELFDVAILHDSDCFSILAGFLTVDILAVCLSVDTGGSSI